MASDFIDNLPPMAEGGAFAAATGGGRWTLANGTLAQLAASLKSGDLADAGEPIRAIPDPWAQARTFGDALRDPGHSLHATAVPQWRGLLALIALRGLYASRYTLSLHEVDLGRDRLFDRVLMQLRPRRAIGGIDDPWTKPVVIRLHPPRGASVALAMVNPACLVSAGRVTTSPAFAEIPWLANGLGDPLDLPENRALPKPALAALLTYLEGVEAALKTLPMSEEREHMLAELARYAMAVEGRIVGARPDATFDIETSPYLPDALAALWGRGRLRESGDPAAASEGLLKLIAGLRPIKGIILVDPAIARRTGRQSHDVAIWGHRMLSDLLGSQRQYEEAKAEAAQQGYVLVKADDLFTDRAAQLVSAAMTRHPERMHDRLLPLKPIALLTDGDLAGRITIDGAGTSATIKLRLQLLTGQGARAETVEIQRTYTAFPRAGDPELLLNRVAALSEATVWPDFRTPKWRHYYARFSYQTGASDQAVPAIALSGRIIAAAIALRTTAAEAVRELDQINRGAMPDVDDDLLRVFTDPETDPDEIDQVLFSSLGYDAVFYTSPRSSPGEEQIGCALLRVEQINPTIEESVVAVDFGTTNTVACFDDQQPIRFEPRLLHPTDSRAPEVIEQRLRDKRWVFQEFLPAQYQQLPIPSVALERITPDRTIATPLIRHVMFLSNDRPPSQSRSQADDDATAKLAEYGKLMPRARFDLKWSTKQQVVRASNDYLQELMLLIAAEGVAQRHDPATLRWRFSVPDSMDDDTRVRFARSIDDMRQHVSPDGERDPLVSEGFAAARYMLAGASGAQFRPGSLNVVLDIGGGTTDISIWVNAVQKWKGSFRDLAGKAFFTATLINNPDILRGIGLPDFVSMMQLADDSGEADGTTPPASAARDKVSARDRTDFAELLFSGPRLEGRFNDDRSWTETLGIEPGEILRATALTFLGGVAWYLGRVCRALIEEGGDDLHGLSARDFTDPTFSLCGRGSGIFRRLHGTGNSDRADTPVTRALTAFSVAAGVEPAARPRLFMTQDTKLEVVRGMVVQMPTMRADAPESTAQPAGLAIRFSGGETLAADADIASAPAVGRTDGVDLTEIEAYLQELRRLTRIDIDPDPSSAALPEGVEPDPAIEWVRISVNTAIETQRTREGRLILHEPPFIAGLRELIHQMTLPPRTRRRHVQVTFNAPVRP